jgi:hypothetical protein
MLHNGDKVRIRNQRFRTELGATRTGDVRRKPILEKSERIQDKARGIRRREKARDELVIVFDWMREWG